MGSNHWGCSVLEISDALRSHAESSGLCRYAMGLTLNTLWPRSFPYAHPVSWGASGHSKPVLAGEGQLPIEGFCESISELLWALLWPGLRSSFNREMNGDQIVKWRSKHDSGMISCSVGKNCKMILDSEKSRFCLSFSSFVHLICLSGVGKFASGEIKFAMFHISEDTVSNICIAVHQNMPHDTFDKIQIAWIAYCKLQKTFKLN